MVGHNYQAHIFNVVVRVNQLMCRNVFVGVVGQVKGQCSIATKMFVAKLEMCFPNCELMNALKLCIHNFGYILMLIFLCFSTLASSKNTVVN
jgi:hypothetical protein